MVTAQAAITCHPNGVPGRGSLDSEIMLIGLGPGREEMRTLKVATGQTGRFTKACLENLNINMDTDCYITNLMCWWSKEPNIGECAPCEARLRSEIALVKPKVIVALGAIPITFFTGFARSGEARGSCLWSNEFNCWIVCCWQPAAVFKTPSIIADVMRDFKKINYIKDKPSNMGDVPWELVTTSEHAQKVLDSDWLRTARFPSLDVECKWDETLQEWTDDIRCLSISDGTQTYVFPEHVLDGLVWPLEGVHWTYHNSMFDTAKLIADQGVDLPICDDTMLMNYSLDERGGGGEDDMDLPVGIHDLKRIAREFCGAGFYDKDVDLKYSPDSVVYPYNAKDAAYTSRLAALFCAWQIDDGVRDFYLTMILPEARICRDEKKHGVFIDSPAVNRLAITWAEEWLRLEDELASEAEALGWVGKKGARFNFNSTQQVKLFCNTILKIPIEDTQADTLAPYSDIPWVEKRIRIKRIDKQLNTYVVDIQQSTAKDSRVHPDASIHATNTGRKVYHKPLIGIIPTGAQYVDPDEAPDEATVAVVKEFSQMRALFSAPRTPVPRVFIEADYSAAELWTAALASGDKVMLEDLLSGDFHSRASESIFQCKQSDYDPAQWKNIRRESKYVTFGVLFFRGAGSLFSPKAGQSGNLGKKYTLPQIKQMVINWHKRYHVHYAWALAQIAEARKTGQQISLTGRKRRYWAPGVYGGNFDNMAVNFPIQSVAHDHLIVARFDVDEAYNNKSLPARSLWDGHDAIYFECDGDFEPTKGGKFAIPTGAAAVAVPMIRNIMQTPRWFDMGIPVEIKCGYNWADAKVIDEDWLKAAA